MVCVASVDALVMQQGSYEIAVDVDSRFHRVVQMGCDAPRVVVGPQPQMADSV